MLVTTPGIPAEVPCILSDLFPQQALWSEQVMLGHIVQISAFALKAFT